MLCMPMPVPDPLKEFVLRCSEDNCRAFERLKRDHEAAVASKQFDLAMQIWARMAQYVQPSNPVVRIFGGIAPYILVDEGQMPPGCL